MARLSLSDLINPIPRADVEQSIYAVLAALSVPTATWAAKSVVRSTITGASAVFAAFSELMSQITRGGFLELAQGDWLTVYARQVYGIERRAATFATGTITLNNSSGNVYLLDPGDLIVRNASTGFTFRNSESITLNPTSTLDAAVVGTEAGAASSSAAHSLTQPVTALLGVTCDNAAGIFASDEETDEALRARCSESLGSRSPLGPWDSYSTALRNATAADGRNLGITRITSQPDGLGGVDLWTATQFGIVPDADVAIAQAAVEAHAQPLGITARVHGAEGVVVDVGFEAWARSAVGAPVDADALRVRLEAAASAHIRSRPVGGETIEADSDPITPPPKHYLFRAGLIAAIHAAAPEVVHVVLTAPSADVELDRHEVALVGAVAGVVHLVEAPTP